jgi:N-methylhydantoinase B/oxoprolinase/acetone carboxylase alpha subunit
MLHQFGIRPDSGGKGRWKGGDGVVREIEILEPLQVSMLSEVSVPQLHAYYLTRCLPQRRTRQPYGMEGGEPGALGRNTWIKQARKEDGDYAEGIQGGPKPRKINIGGKATVFMGRGDRLLIETPGAGAWGHVIAPEHPDGPEDMSHLKVWEPRGSLRSKSQPEFGGF